MFLQITSPLNKNIDVVLFWKQRFFPLNVQDTELLRRWRWTTILGQAMGQCFHNMPQNAATARQQSMFAWLLGWSSHSLKEAPLASYQYAATCDWLKMSIRSYYHMSTSIAKIRLEARYDYSQNTVAEHIVRKSFQVTADSQHNLNLPFRI